MTDASPDRGIAERAEHDRRTAALRVLLLVAGIGAFGIQIATGYQAARVSAAVKARRLAVRRS